jgi:hypothetical protein
MNAGVDASCADSYLTRQMTPKLKKALVVTGVLVAVGALRAWYSNDRARRSYEQNSVEAQLADPDSGLMQRLQKTASNANAGSRRLLFRVDGVAHAEGCEGHASQVFVGVDSNQNGQLEQAEQERVPMTFCSVDSMQGRIERTPPNAYCPRPGAMVVLQHPGQRADQHAEFLVCFDPTQTNIESAYAVYDAR